MLAGNRKRSHAGICGHRAAEIPGANGVDLENPTNLDCAISRAKSEGRSAARLGGSARRSVQTSQPIQLAGHQRLESPESEIRAAGLPGLHALRRAGYRFP